MPHIHRLSITDTIQQMTKLHQQGIMGFAVFPVTPPDNKNAPMG